MPEQATIGGMLATGMTGPLRHGYGGLRDYCIGVRFVTGDGRKGKGGGRVVKNVAGFDLMKLLIGSRGTLAIITGASFKLFPAPRQTKTFVAEFANRPKPSSFAMPCCARLFRRSVWSWFRPKRRRCCRERNSPGKGWSIYVRASGSDAVLASYRASLALRFRKTSIARRAELWRGSAELLRTLPQRNPESLLISLSLPLADVQAALNELESIGAADDLAFAVIGTVGVGHLLVGLWPAGQQATLGAVLDPSRTAAARCQHILYCPESSR